MLKLAVYDIKTLQSFQQLLHKIEQGRMTVELAKATIADEVKQRAGETRIVTQRANRAMDRNKAQDSICPSCGKDTFINAVIDGVAVMTCSGVDTKCGYSEVIK